jgi:hypothetical protein
MWMVCLKMRSTIANSLLLLALAIFAGCGHKPTPADGTLVDAYVDLRVASIEFGETAPAARIARTEVLKKYGYTAVTFDSAIAKMKRDPDAWEPFQNAVSARLDSLSMQQGVTVPRDVRKPAKIPGAPIRRDVPPPPPPGGLR